MNIFNKFIRGDKVIWIVAILLGIISLIVVYSAASALVVNTYNGSTGQMLMKHASTLLIGFVMMYIAYRIDYRHFAKAALILLIPCLALLLYTLLFGRNINQASRSISLGGFSFQPSEIAKIILITYISRQLVMMENSLKNFKDVLIRLALPIMVTVALIFPENLSTAAILLVVCLVLLFIGRVKFLHIMAILAIGIIGLGLYIAFDAARTSIGNNRALKAQKEYVGDPAEAPTYTPKKTRIQTWIGRIEVMGNGKEQKVDPFDDHHYQQTYAKIAVASSSIIGKGPGKSQQRNFLPHPYSDFIYAIIVEEYGLVGAIIVLMLYVILFTRVLRIGVKKPLTFGAYMSFGLGFLVIVQAMINMGVSIGLLPVTGQPLPFVSMGGTSMMATGLILGMILSVTKNMEDDTMSKEEEIESIMDTFENEREPESRD